MSDIKQKIVDQIVERLENEPLGDLLSEVELKDVVAIALQEVFFKERVEEDRYGSIRRKDPPLIFEAVQKSLSAAAEKAVNDWMRDHAGEVADYWTKALDTGIEKYVMQMQDAKAKAVISQALGPLLQKLNEERSKIGLPWLHIVL